jgi:hypothetical protein
MHATGCCDVRLGGKSTGLCTIYMDTDALAVMSDMPPGGTHTVLKSQQQVL